MEPPRLRSVPPIWGHTDPPFARRHGMTLSRGKFFAQVAAFAERLPDRPYVINLCEDRYLFTVAFAAALSRRQVTLLPPDRSRRSLELIFADYADKSVVSDTDLPLPNGEDRIPIEPDIAAAAAASHPFAPTPTDAALVAFTSGSTGRPQGHPKTWGSLQYGAELIQDALQLRAGDSLVATVPAQHMYGLELSVLLPLVAGTVMAAARPFFPADVAAALGSVPSPRILVTTPLHLRVLIDSGLRLPALARVVSATAPLSRTLAQAAERALAAPVLEIYGCTEAGSIASRRTVADDWWTLFPGVRLQGDGGGCRVEASYLPRPVPLADLIERHDERRFRLLGRSADLVNIAGKRHSMAALDRVLNEIDGVHDGAFLLVETEDHDAVPRLVAFAVAPGLSENDLLQNLRARLEAVFVPKRIILLERLPRTETGKLPRQALLDCLERLSAGAVRG